MKLDRERTIAEIKAAREGIDIPVDGKGRIRWRELRPYPDRLIIAIEGQAVEMMEAGVFLGGSTIQRKSQSLARAIAQDYPGGLTGLRERLGLSRTRRANGFWKRPDAADVIKEEAHQILAEKGSLSIRILDQEGRGDLLGALNKYPGGMRKLKEDLEVKQDAKPAGYWTPENTLKEASQFVEQYGALTHPLLNKHHRLDLAGAIGKFEGAMPEVKDKLGLPHRSRNNFWKTPEGQEQMRKEVEEFYQQTGEVTRKMLLKAGKGGLCTAISRNYEGSWTQLWADLGKGSTGKPNGYWNEKTVLEEAAKFYEQYGDLKSSVLRSNGHEPLYRAIVSNLKGGIEEAREYLGLKPLEKPIEIPVEEANAALDSLFDGGAI